VTSSPSPAFSYREGIRDTITVGAVAGSLLYVGLSILYEQFYVELGLHPDDVGLTRTAILLRAAAGVVAIVAIGLAAAVVTLVLFFLVWALLWGLRKLRRKHRVESRAVGKFKDPRLASFLSAVYPIAGMPDPDGWYPFRRRRILMIAGLAVLIVFVVMFIVTLPKVRTDAEAASNGGNVVPRTFLGIPTLSIESRPCHALWLGSTPKPQRLEDPTLHCLGSANGTTLFRTSSETVRVPSSAVATTFD
jgi:MFS family permease